VDWQLLAVALIVAAAALELLRRTVRAWRGAGGCGTGCGGGCGAPKNSEESGKTVLVGRLTVRRRNV
jgi:hypothetical protein